MCSQPGKWRPLNSCIMAIWAISGDSKKEKIGFNEPITLLLPHLTWQLKPWRHKIFTTGESVFSFLILIQSMNNWEKDWRFWAKPELGQMGRVHPFGFDTNLTLSPTQTYYSFPHYVVGPFQRTQFNRFRPNVSPHQSQGIETINWSNVF